MFSAEEGEHLGIAMSCWTSWPEAAWACSHSHSGIVRVKEIQPAVSAVHPPDCSLLVAFATDRIFSNTEGRHQDLLSPGVDAYGSQSNLVPLVREGAVVQVARETPAVSVDVPNQLAILHHLEGCCSGHRDFKDFPNSDFSSHRYHHGVACHACVHCTHFCVFEGQIVDVVR